MLLPMVHTTEHALHPFTQIRAVFILMSKDEDDSTLTIAVLMKSSDKNIHYSLTVFHSSYICRFIVCKGCILPVFTFFGVLKFSQIISAQKR